MSVSAYASGKWKAEVKWLGVKHYLGIFGSESAARAACDAEYSRLRDGSSPLLLGSAVMTVQAFADSIGVRHGTVKRWVHEGMPVTRSNGLVRVDPSTANAWLAEYRRGSIAYARRSVLYAVLRDSDGAVKLGWTSDAGRRLRELYKLTEEGELHLLAVMPGDKPDELLLHARFRRQALGGEWFAISADEAIAALLELVSTRRGAA